MSKIGKTMMALGVVAGLGVACLPLSSYALDNTPKSEELDVMLTVKDSISLELKGGNIAEGQEFAGSVKGDEKAAILNLGNLDADGSLYTASVYAIVSTSHATGYNLKIQSAKDSTSMINGRTGSVATIETLGSGETLAVNMKVGDKAVSRWGYKGGKTENWSAIPAKSDDADVIALSEGSIADDKTEVSFGVVVAPGQEEGTYTGTVTLTATINGDITD